MTHAIIKDFFPLCLLFLIAGTFNFCGLPGKEQRPVESFMDTYEYNYLSGRSNQHLQDSIKNYITDQNLSLSTRVRLNCLFAKNMTNTSYVFAFGIMDDFFSSDSIENWKQLPTNLQFLVADTYFRTLYLHRDSSKYIPYKHHCDSLLAAAEISRNNKISYTYTSALYNFHLKQTNQAIENVSSVIAIQQEHLHSRLDSARLARALHIRSFILNKIEYENLSYIDLINAYNYNPYNKSIINNLSVTSSKIDQKTADIFFSKLDLEDKNLFNNYKKKIYLDKIAMAEKYEADTTLFDSLLSLQILPVSLNNLYNAVGCDYLCQYYLLSNTFDLQKAKRYNHLSQEYVNKILTNSGFSITQKQNIIFNIRLQAAKISYYEHDYSRTDSLLQSALSVILPHTTLNHLTYSNSKTNKVNNKIIVLLEQYVDHLISEGVTNKNLSKLIEAERYIQLCDSLLVQFLKQDVPIEQHLMFSNIYSLGHKLMIQLYEITDDYSYLSAAFKYHYRQNQLLFYNSYYTESLDLSDSPNAALLKERWQLVQLLIGLFEDYKSNEERIATISHRIWDITNQIGFKKEPMGSFLHEPVFSLDSFQQLIQSDEIHLILERQADHNLVSVLWVTKDTVGGYLTEASATFDHVIQFTQNIQEKNSAISSRSDSIFEYLFQPIAPLLADHYSIVCHTNGVLQTLPFDILIDQNNEMLIENHLVLQQDLYKYHSPTIVPAPHQNILVIGSTSEPNEDLLNESTHISYNSRATSNSYLPFAQKEIDHISSHYDATVLTGENATIKNIVHKAKTHNVLHIALHGFNDPYQPAHSRLVLDDEQQLFYYEIANLPLYADLVCLSACNTGKGTISSGAYKSLTHAFREAGCKNIIQTLWNINDAAAAEIMKNYYNYIGEDVLSAEALRQAKLAYLKQSPLYLQHPYYWAGFSYHGTNDLIRISSKKDSRIYWYVIFILTPLFLISIYFYYRKIKLDANI